MDGDVDRQQHMMDEAEKQVTELITNTLRACNFDNTYPGYDAETWANDESYTALQCAMRATSGVWERTQQRHRAGATLTEDDFVALAACVSDFMQTIQAFMETSQRHDQFLDSLVDSYNTLTDEAKAAAVAFKNNPREFTSCDAHDSFETMVTRQKATHEYLSAAVDFRTQSMVPLSSGELEKMLRMVLEAQEAVARFRTLNSV